MLGMILGLLLSLASIIGLINFISMAIRKFNPSPAQNQDVLQEIPKWLEEGFITPEQGESLLARYRAPETKVIKKFNFIRILSIIGAVLLGIGVILFVASNWKSLPDLIRTIMLLSVTFGTFWLGYYYHCREASRILGESLVFLASLFWGASLALIAQIYHIPQTGNWWIFLLWAFPILPLAWLFDSSPIFLLSSLLFLLWNCFYSVSQNADNYYYLVIVFGLLLPFAKTPLQSGANLAALIIAAGLAAGYRHDWLVLIMALGVLAYFFLKARSKKYFLTGSLIFIFWMFAFFAAHEKIFNFYYLIPLALLLYLSYRNKLREGLALNICGFIVWFVLGLTSLYQLAHITYEPLTALFLLILIGVNLYLVGMAHRQPAVQPERKLYKIFGFMLCLIFIYAYSYLGVLEELNRNSEAIFSWTGLSLAVLALLLMAFNWHRKNLAYPQARHELAMTVMILLAATLVLLKPAWVVPDVLALNLCLLGLGIATLLSGYELQQPQLFNAGIVIFVLFVISRYFDIFWKLLDRSLLFIIAGALVMIYAAFLEKTRRKIVSGMSHE